MLLQPEDWGQLLSLVIIAFALGLDAFSLGLGIGMRGLALRDIYVISLIIGVFHFVMPLIGMVIGFALSAAMGTVAIYAGGVLLCALGINMTWSGFRGGKGAFPMHALSLWSIVLLAFSVSIDSLSAGLSLGLFSVNILLAVSMLGIGGGVMAGIGLTAGRFASMWVGDYGELIGGTILLAFGLKMLL